MAIINLILSNTDVTRWNDRSYPISIHEEERDIPTSISIFKNFAESIQNISRFHFFSPFQCCCVDIILLSIITSARNNF